MGEKLNSEKMTPCILCGGKGSRLSSLFPDTPKALVPVNGRPFIKYIFDQLICAGFKEVILCVGYKGRMIEKTFENRYRKLSIYYSHEITAMGTLGAVINALPLIKTDKTMVMNGDSYVDARLEDFINYSQKNQNYINMLVCEVPDSSRYGAVKLENENRVKRFFEKGRCLGNYINAGVYIMNKNHLKRQAYGEIASFEYDFFPDQVKRNLVYGYPARAAFIDIGVPEDYHNATKFFNNLKKRCSSEQ